MASRNLADALSKATTALYGVIRLAAHGATTAGDAVQADDPRLSDARTPAAHAATHATGGSDPITAAAIDAEPELGNPASDGQILSSTAAGARSWINPPNTGMTNPMTTADDIIVAGASGAPTRMAKGANNTVFGVDGSGVLGYKPDPNGSVPQQLGYAEITADASTTSATAADVAGLSVTVTVGTRPIIVEFGASEVKTNQDQSRAIVTVYDTTGAAAVNLGIGTPSGASKGHAMLLKRRLAPAAGSRTYKVQLHQANDAASTTATIRAAATNPAYIRVYEV